MWHRDNAGGGGGGGGGRAAAELGSSVTLTDGVGQRVEVLLENRLGEGGQRNVTVYCPVWMVNTSHYRLRCAFIAVNIVFLCSPLLGVLSMKVLFCIRVGGASADKTCRVQRRSRTYILRISIGK